MTKRITVLPKGQTISCKENETVLETLLRAGIYMPSGCHSGVCAACKGKILSGDIIEKLHSPHVLTDSERQAGYTLFCRAIPTTDISIEGPLFPHAEDLTIKTLPCRVESIEKIRHDVAILTLKLPSNPPFTFLAGQYIDILMGDGKKRSFSIANSPEKKGYLELHIRAVPGGAFSQYVLEEMKGKEVLRFTGPLGGFFLRENSDKPIIFIASGTGFAPVKSIVEYAFHQGVQREMVFYWGARTQADLYMIELPLSWQQKPNFTFIPVLSETSAEDAWMGRTGLVHQAVLEDFQDLSGWQVYASGSPLMVEAAHSSFMEKKLSPDEFFSDAFFLEKDLLKKG